MLSCSASISDFNMTHIVMSIESVSKFQSFKVFGKTKINSTYLKHAFLPSSDTRSALHHCLYFWCSLCLSSRKDHFVCRGSDLIPAMWILFIIYLYWVIYPTIFLLFIFLTLTVPHCGVSCYLTAKWSLWLAFFFPLNIWFGLYYGLYCNIVLSMQPRLTLLKPELMLLCLNLWTMTAINYVLDPLKNAVSSLALIVRNASANTCSAVSF